MASKLEDVTQSSGFKFESICRELSFTIGSICIAWRLIYSAVAYVKEEAVVAEGHI